MKTKAMKRFFSLLLVLCLLAGEVPQVGIVARALDAESNMIPSVSTEFATQSRTENFSRNYTLTGDGATDMKNIALAQEGRTESQMGYTEAWCADFVGDCAKLCGQSAAVPLNGSSNGLNRAIQNAGGQIIYSPNKGSKANARPGDICFVDWDPENGNGIDHTEIVYYVSGSAVYTIGGNTGGDKVTKHSPLTDEYVHTIVRPNYSGSSVTPTPTVKEDFSCNATITTTAGITVNLYNNPGDTSRLTYFSQGQSTTSTKGARMSDGSTWYQIQVNHRGQDISVWLNASSSGVSVKDQAVKPNVTLLNETANENFKDTEARIVVKINNWWGGNASKMSEGGLTFWTSAGAEYKTYSTAISPNVNDGWYAYIDYTQKMLLPQEKYTCQAYGVANGYKFYSDKFSFTTGHADLGSDFYAKISVSGSLYLTTDSNRNVSVQKNDNSKYQIWHFVRLSDGCYQIRAVYDESVVLDVQNAGSSTGTKVNVSPQWGSFNQNKAQEWFLGKQGNGYALRPKCAHKALDVTKGPGVGGKLQLYDSNNTAAQIFTITKVSKPITNTTVTLSFDNRGGKPYISPQKKTSDSSSKTFSIPPAKLTKSGYTFKGWSKSSTASRASYQSGDSITISENTTLYAVWEKEESITLSYSTGTFTAIPSQKKTFPAQSGFEELAYSNEATFTISSVRPAKEGYTFLGWSKSSSASSASYQPGGSITIYSDTTLYAVWKRNETTYTLTFDTQGGSPISPLTITDDQEVKVFSVPTVRPERDGYEFLGWNLYSAATGPSIWPGNTIRINGNTTLYAIWVKTDGNGETPEEPDPEKPDGDITINIYIINFGDVSPNAYYAEAVGWAVQNAITSGTSDKTFSPNASCTRAQAVTFLWKAAGSPEPASAENPFTDVRASDYYYKAVLWAVENGVTSGTSATTFGPSEKCTRAQIVSFLWRAAGSLQVGSTGSFGDVSTDAYYSDAVEWAVDGGVTSGTSATTFSPNAVCTRGQIVTFLYHYAG